MKRFISFDRFCIFHGLIPMLRRLFLLALGFSLLSACVTPSLGTRESFPREPDFITPEKSAFSQTLYGNDSFEISELYDSLLTAQASGADVERINAILAKERRSSLEEAILVLNLLHNFMASHMQAQQVSDFEAPFQDEKVVTLAELSALYNIDLVDLIENNLFLQNIGVYSLLLKLPRFLAQDQSDKLLMSSIRDKFVYYREFVKVVALALESPDEDVGLSTAAEEGEIVVDPRTASEKILEEVETLLSVNKYYSAVVLLQKIPEEDPSYELAQQKILLTSRKAVEELRRKAALSYQNANHIDTDFQARESYLLEAKKYLEFALERYPNDEQIPRVEMNLKVIEDNLSFLNKGRLQER